MAETENTIQSKNKAPEGESAAASDKQRRQGKGRYPYKPRKPRYAKKDGQGGQDASKSGQTAPKTGQNAPKSGQAAPKSGQAAPKVGQNAPKVGQAAPRTGQNAPRTGQAAPRTGQNAPKAGQNASRTGQTAPRAGQNAPRGAESASSARRQDTRRRGRSEQKAPEQQGVLRRRSAEDIMTAEQKAFAEATDILLQKERKEAAVQADGSAKGTVEIVGVRFRSTGKPYYFAPAGEVFKEGDAVIVETAAGLEYGTVAIPNCTVAENDTVKPLKPVLRRADEADAQKQARNEKLEQEAVKVWDELVAKHGLEMNLSDIAYTFDNTRLVFYFTADGRVDFRELVKDLAGVFHTRIELRQIGVRDEAKMLGGLGVCGMPFCCSRFLSDFCQVSIKMAKEQNLSLSSSKISGNCGRLMCCLRFEQEIYEKEHETFPRPGMVVRTAQGAGVVTESNFISGKIKVQLDGDAAGASKVFTRDEVKVTGYARKAEPEPVDKELKELED